MKIAINGLGVAGPTLAWWLKHYGYESVLFERAPELRTGGYIIDFWGLGYGIAEKMGILSQLQSKGYMMEDLRLVDKHGDKTASLNTKNLRSLVEGRFLSIARSELAATILCSEKSVSYSFK